MYLPDHFAEPRPAELERIVRENPLGILVTHHAGLLDANHVPFEFDPTNGPHGVLTCHVARANPVWSELSPEAPVLVVFRGADGYISPNWYPSKHEQHRQVPTWNYEVVHAHGVATVRDDEKFVRGLVARLTRAHEASEPKPWRMGDAAPGFIDTMLKSIVGIEVRVERLVGKVKLSQNKEPRDRQNAADELAKRDQVALATAMRNAG
ncbi:MAG: FMN-binding negative transcriptional regulator [Burkholderiaceae bacterium]